MLNITGVKDGIVLDHIRAGWSMIVYKHLHLEDLSCEVAIIRNARSNRMGRKDIIKIEAGLDVVNLDVLGFIDPGITVNIIQDDKVTQKLTVQMPKVIKNVISCRNPRCISSVEQELPQIFVLSDEENQVYRCKYCEEKFDRRRF